MFNFSANNLIFVSKSQHDKCNIFILKDPINKVQLKNQLMGLFLTVHFIGSISVRGGAFLFCPPVGGIKLDDTLFVLALKHKYDIN